MSDSINRRYFMQTSAAAGAAVAVGSSLARAESGANDKVVLGVMGLSRGRALATGFARQKNVEVKYVCDVDAQRAQTAAREIANIAGRAPQTTQDFRHILDDKSVDALVCAAPNHWHAPATILACAAGKHVYVEKPCCHNPLEGELMVQAARKHNRAVQMGNQRRSGPGTIEAIQRLHEGAIGRVHLSKSWYFNLRGSIGRGKQIEVPAYVNYELWQGPAPRRPYMSNVVHYNWHWFWHWGNGELGNNGVHSIDLCRWGLAADYPIAVTSSGGRYYFDDDQQTPDTHTVCLEFDGDRQIVWQGLSCNRHGSGFVSFYGKNGAMDLESNGTYTIYDKGNKEVERVVSPSLGEPEHLANFLAAIRSDKPESLNAEIETGHKSTLLCHLGNIAHRVGRRLNCDPANGHVRDDRQATELWSREYEPGWEPKV